MASLKSGIKKKQNWKIFIFQWDILRIQNDKIPIGLHGEGEKSSLSDRGPYAGNLQKYRKIIKYPYFQKMYKSSLKFHLKKIPLFRQPDPQKKMQFYFNRLWKQCKTMKKLWKKKKKTILSISNNMIILYHQFWSNFAFLKSAAEKRKKKTLITVN